MNINKQVSSAISRVHQSLGRDVVVTNYEYDETGGNNAYADGDWVKTSNSPTTVTARVAFSGGGSEKSGGDGSGADVQSEVTLFLEYGAVPVHRGTEDNTRPTEFRDTISGVSYRAVDVSHQDDLLAVDVEEL